jgi:hypothetical protein
MSNYQSSFRLYFECRASVYALNVRFSLINVSTLIRQPKTNCQSSPSRALPLILTLLHRLLESLPRSIVMADSGIACANAINIPLERSLYVGNILSGILYGENSLQPSNRLFLHILHVWRQDWKFPHSLPLYITSPIVLMIIVKAKYSISYMVESCSHLLPSTWLWVACGANTCGSTTATILAVRSDILWCQKRRGTMSAEWQQGPQRAFSETDSSYVPCPFKALLKWTGWCD